MGEVLFGSIVESDPVSDEHTLTLLGIVLPADVVSFTANSTSILRVVLTEDAELVVVANAVPITGSDASPRGKGNGVPYFIAYRRVDNGGYLLP